MVGMIIGQVVSLISFRASGRISPPGGTTKVILQSESDDDEEPTFTPSQRAQI